jgi:hypothetical protein
MSIQEENGQIIVDELRPMSDAPKTESFLCAFADNKSKLYEGYFDSIGNIWVGENYHDIGLIKGWIPMPIYRTKENKNDTP